MKNVGAPFTPLLTPLHEIFSDPSGVSSRLNLRKHACGIKPQCRSIFEEVFILEGVLIFEQEIVHFPEAAPGASRLSRLGGVFGMRMGVGQGEIAENEPQALAQTLLNSLHRQMGLSAERAFVITVFQQS